MKADQLRLAIVGKCDSAATVHGIGDGTGNLFVRGPLPIDPLPKWFGLYPIAPGTDRTRIGVLDFDNHGDDPLDWSAVASAVRPVMMHLRAMGHEPMPFRSSGGLGAHVWLIWDDLQSAAAVRSLLIGALEACGLESGDGGLEGNQVEVFPKQDAVPFDSVGSCIDPPLAGASVGLDPDTLDPVDEIPFIITSQPVGDPPPVAETDEAAPKWDIDLIASALAVISPDEYSTWVDVLRSLKGAAVRAGIDDDVARAVAEAWSRTSEKHGDREFTEKWMRGFRKEMAGRGRSLGTLFWTATKHGWERPATPCPIASVRVVESEPRTYLVTLSGYEETGEIAVRSDDMLNRQRWRRAIMERIDQIIDLPASKDVNRLMRDAPRVGAGADGTLVGRFRARLIQFLEEHLHRDRAELRVGHAWYDDDTARSWFRWQDFWDWLRKRRHYDVDQPAALYFIRQLGGDVADLDMGGDYGTVDAWWVPIDPRATIPEPAAVLIPTTDDGPF